MLVLDRYGAQKIPFREVPRIPWYGPVVTWYSTMAMIWYRGAMVWYHGAMELHHETMVSRNHHFACLSKCLFYVVQAHLTSGLRAGSWTNSGPGAGGRASIQPSSWHLARLPESGISTVVRFLKGPGWTGLAGYKKG